MTFLVTGSPSQAFTDAISAVLKADATLTGLITGVFAHVSEATRTAFPYLVLGRRTMPRESGPMQIAGGVYELQIDVWSDAKGPFETSTILSRVYALLERRGLTVTGFDLLAGSLTRDAEEIFPEPDTDDPKQLIYHGVQIWVGEIHESS